MAAGCVVVGSATPPVQEVIRDGENGWLVDFHDPAAIASRVVDVLARYGEQGPIRLAARRTIVDDYDLHTVCLRAQLQLIRTARHRWA
jgi:glycosyltransferase involved in cell wall biosynthesis